MNWVLSLLFREGGLRARGRSAWDIVLSARAAAVEEQADRGTQAPRLLLRRLAADEERERARNPDDQDREMLGSRAGVLRRDWGELGILREHAGNQVEQLVAGDEVLAEP